MKKAENAAMKCSCVPSMCLRSIAKILRKLPISMRKANLARLLAGRSDGIFLRPFEQGEIGPDLFRKACEFGLEGLVSKHRDALTRAAGRRIGSRSRTASSKRLTE